MAKILGELVFEVIASIVRGVVYALWLKALTWMSTRVHSRAAAIAVVLVMGLVLFFLMPIVTGLLSF
jgi:hypothetical protein